MTKLPKTFNQFYTGVSGTCPTCGMFGELLRYYGEYDVSCTVEHSTSDRQVSTCEISPLGTLNVRGSGWWYTSPSESEDAVRGEAPNS